MNIMNASGESSRKGRENGDDSTGSERPLKKARYAWQVKGKYHLKNETDESNKNLTRPSTEPSTSQLSSTSQNPKSTFGREMENYIEQDYNNLDSVINPVNSLLAPINSISKNQQQYPRYLSSHERASQSNMLRSYSNVKNVSMVNNAEDQCIAQWQARQIVKGCLDNTLNRVLESWTSALPPEEANFRFLALDFAEFINHLPGDNSVENEGILMAISAHGLQNTSSGSSNDASNADYDCIACTHDCDIPSPLPSLSPIVSDGDNSQQCNNNQQCEIPSEIQDWQSDNQNANNATPFAYFSEPSQSPCFCDENQHSHTDSVELESNYDFMNAAVLYAIKSKGLTAAGMEYG